MYRLTAMQKRACFRLIIEYKVAKMVSRSALVGIIATLTKLPESTVQTYVTSLLDRPTTKRKLGKWKLVEENATRSKNSPQKKCKQSLKRKQSSARKRRAKGSVHKRVKRRANSRVHKRVKRRPKSRVRKRVKRRVTKKLLANRKDIPNTVDKTFTTKKQILPMIGKLHELLYDVFRDPEIRANLEYNIKAVDIWSVIFNEDESKVLSCASWHGGNAEVIFVCTHEDFRKMGLATRMLENLVSAIKEDKKNKSKKIAVLVEGTQKSASYKFYANWINWEKTVKKTKDDDYRFVWKDTVEDSEDELDESHPKQKTDSEKTDESDLEMTTPKPQKPLHSRRLRSSTRLARQKMESSRPRNSKGVIDLTS